MFQDPDYHDYCHHILMAAVQMAADGFLIFPCLYQTKKPATPSGFYNASANPATIRRWFGGGFRYNLAVRTGLASGIWVLDADNLDSLTALEDRYGRLRGTRQSQTACGIHAWFKTTGIPIPSSNGRIGPASM
jgi:hypothetical protein